MLCRRTNLFSIRTCLATDFSQNKNKLILDMRDARLFQRYESPNCSLPPVEFDSELVEAK